MSAGSELETERETWQNESDC